MKKKQTNCFRRSNRTSGQSRAWVICKPPSHSSKVKRPKTSCDQFEANKQTCLQSKIKYRKPQEYSFTSKAERLHDKTRFTERLYVSSRCLLVSIFNGKIYHFKVMLFSLNSASRIFTKLFKPILRLLRSPGMLLITYLDDILPIAPTAELCLAQDKLLMKLLQDLGFLVNMNKSVSSYSYSKNNFSGFCYRLCKYDNFSPRGKTVRNNSEGQFFIRSKFDIYSKPVSVCGHVFSYTPSTKASSFALQKNSTLNKQSIKQSWSEQEILLQSKSPTKFSGSSELGMVGNGNATPLHSSSDSPTSGCENSNRLIFPRLGCNYGACQNSRSLGVEKTVVPYKQERTANLFHCSKIFCSLSERHSCSAVGGQYCCCKLSGSCSGNKVPSFVRSGNCNFGMVFKEKNLSFSNSHTRYCKQNPRWFVSSKARKHGMDVRFQCFSSDSSCLSEASSGPLCF